MAAFTPVATPAAPRDATTPAMLVMAADSAFTSCHLSIAVYCPRKFALALAEALPKGGTIVSCEIDPERTEIAKRYFAESPHGSKIEVRLGPASETLKRVLGPFDICFIDADIEKYAAYYEACMDLVRRGGLIILDNMLHGGRVIDARDEATKQIDEINRRIRNDAQVENVLLPVRDGIMLVRKL
jgi:caffeoyl-CoA O-methyltransferase